MELTTIRELFKDRESYLGKKVTIGGWVRSLRDSKTFGFIVVNDGSYFEPLQIVYHDEMENFAEVSKLNVGAAIIVKGTLVATPQAKQPFEIQADEVQIEGASASDYPLQKKRHTFEYLRTISHLRPRTNTFQAVFRVRSLAAYAIHKFFQERGFVYVHTPLITGSDCEGAGEMFRVTTLDMDQIPKNEDGTVDYTTYVGNETRMDVYNGDSLLIITINEYPDVPDEDLGELVEVWNYDEYIEWLHDEVIDEYDCETEEEIQEHAEDYYNDWQKYSEFDYETYQECQLEVWESLCEQYDLEVIEYKIYAVMENLKDII